MLGMSSQLNNESADQDVARDEGAKRPATWPRDREAPLNTHQPPTITSQVLCQQFFDHLCTRYGNVG